MQIIIMTRDRYLEYGLISILSGHRVTTGRELFGAEKRCQPLPEDSYVILCDRNLERLTYCMFCGRRFLVIPVFSVRCLTDIRQAIRRGAWLFGHTARPLTRTEMVVVFGVVFHEYGFTFLADRLGITMKTVCAHLYNAMEKNGLRGVSVKYLCSTADR
ncbi:LuxR family transcriptional regulator [Escherichia coli O4]|nr:LuxR family transcriptional regulator [Escherichia coli]EKK2314073.1 LuxR family transcriptional regulator [Escherichia coli O4]EEW5075153.1 LuxR family transcriptional regulator [Escherichia coli]EEY2486725.1 LuxR family transcriptional regulator [Escherichia coli]EFE9533468.1 LuxR family transcriptional regulator [Escherichia coli]